MGNCTGGWFWFLVFNATSNTSSVILWLSVLLVEETGVPRENHGPSTSNWQTLSRNARLNMADILRGFYNFFYDKETRKYQMCEISFESLK
jgi:hypothetical protein